MKDNVKPLYVRKSLFLQSVYDVYKCASDDYIITLANSLMIIYKCRKTGDEDFNKYDGWVKL